eukprot:TRINITY_DN836_c0_g1_i2.p1 TRINITY_DN836_c0_g1~~TRINITY_DN836_c0_g1_i2.p1  ORF type:complete len:322 (-),score=71.08 TRINITY_DN836_c0_g1_i2:20-985(-)
MEQRKKTTYLGYKGDYCHSQSLIDRFGGYPVIRDKEALDNPSCVCSSPTIFIGQLSQEMSQDDYAIYHIYYCSSCLSFEVYRHLQEIEQNEWANTEVDWGVSSNDDWGTSKDDWGTSNDDWGTANDDWNSSSTSNLIELLNERDNKLNEEKEITCTQISNEDKVPLDMGPNGYFRSWYIEYGDEPEIKLTQKEKNLASKFSKMIQSGDHFEEYEKEEGTKIYKKFKKSMRNAPQHCVRFGGDPLFWKQDIDDLEMTPCNICDSDVIYQFQLMPTLLSLLETNEDESVHLGFGTVTIFSCESVSCSKRKSVKCVCFVEEEIT